MKRIWKYKFSVIIFLLSGLVLFGKVNLCLSKDTAASKNLSLGAASGEYYRLYLEYKNTGDNKKALEYLKLYELMGDSLELEHRNQQLEEIHSRYENDQKQQAVQKLVQENRLKELMISRNRYIISGIAGLSILLVLVVALVIRQNRLKADQYAFSLEQNLLRSQMNPHFIFNALTNIQSFILRKETDLSLKYLGSFSDLIKNILESSGRKFVPLQKELSVISNYFKLQQLRFGDKLEFDIKVDEGLDPYTKELPPMMVQPLIENAIEHGIQPKAGEGHVYVRFILRDEGLMVEVEDNGVGRHYMKEQNINKNSHHAGLALVILKERLESMNKGRSKKNRMEIVDLFDGEAKPAGTLVRLEITI
jgi:LytS/YehU family sensor histidine kinase